NMENSFFKNVQRNDQYPLLYEATQSIWKAINNSDNSPVELTNHEMDYHYEIDLSMDEHDSSSTSDVDMEITNNKAIELKEVLEK
ncbi:12103_t:CDS:1, partial [Dentiscutata erythropus]